MTKKETTTWSLQNGISGCSDCMCGLARAGETVMKPALLLHSCCGPCSTSVIERLVPDYDITVFFYNPNIAPEEEYRRRQLPGLELAANIGNSTINLAGLVPWGIAASVPLTTMEVGPEVLLLSFYLYLLPLWCWLKSKK